MVARVSTAYSVLVGDVGARTLRRHDYVSSWQMAEPALRAAYCLSVMVM
jgi:hypothetical protein